MTIEWGPIREHDGSAECPAEARDVPCMIYNPDSIWLGGVYGVKGKEWLWKTVTAYRLPADVPAPAPAADPVRDALVEAFDDTLTHLIVLVCMVETNTLPPKLSGFESHIEKARAALALARGETK